MRAKVINELNFERNINPKASMKTGGINFSIEFTNDFKELREEITNKLKTLEGKIITVKARKYWKDGNSAITGWEQHAILVEKIFDPGFRVHMDELIVSLWVADKHFRYDLGDLDQEIYVAS